MKKRRARSPMSTAYRRIVANSAATGTRRITHINGDNFGTSAKHNHYRDFGWPEQVEFPQFYRMYCRNSIASAVVDKTVSKVWQDNPGVWEAEEPTMSKSEAEIADRFADIRVWQGLAEADRRAMVGRYAAVILRLADSKPFDQPVDRVAGGIMGIVGVIPCWESQLLPSMWDTNPQSENYGSPTMYQFNEAAITDVINSAPRQFAVHPDRVIIWSQDGTIHCRSELESIYNDLIDAEKIKGSGGEGFWKTARGAPMIEAGAGVDPQDLARSMGVDVAGIKQALNDQIDDFMLGFDKGLVLGGMTAKPLQISLPQPKEFLEGPINSIAAARMIPVRMLMGSQSGERASTEDAKAWALTCNSRRVNRCKPLILEFINRLEAWGIIPERDWFIGWPDLTESTGEEKVEKAAKMADINVKTQPGDIPPFTPDEIREAAGFKPSEDEVFDDFDAPPPKPADIREEVIE